jgi:hypothetical protein
MIGGGDGAESRRAATQNGTSGLPLAYHHCLGHRGRSSLRISGPQSKGLILPLAGVALN